MIATLCGCLGRGAVEAVEVRVHGDVGQDGPQREGVVPGAAAARETAQHLSAAGCRQVAVAAAS